MSEQLCLIGRLRLRVLGGLVKGPWSNAGASEAARRVYAAKALDKQPWTRTLGALEGAGRRNRLRRKRPPETRGGERGGGWGAEPPDGRHARARPCGLTSTGARSVVPSVVPDASAPELYGRYRTAPVKRSPYRSAKNGIAAAQRWAGRFHFSVKP